MDWVTATDLDRWADERSAEGTLPQLLRRLIVALTERRAALDMPSGDSVNTGGWDGILNLDQGTEHLPSGLSCWEFGTNKDKKGKADDDYKKRTEKSEGLSPAETTYVGVTPRKWPSGKKKWVAERKAEKVWRDVRFLDADDLEAMLEQAPAVAIWLAEQMRKITGSFESLDEYWTAWTVGENLPRGLVLAGRQDVAGELLQWAQGSPARRMIRAHTPDEAIAFVAAAFNEAQAAAGETTRTRTIIVKDQAAFQAAKRWKSPLIIVVQGQGIEDATTAVQAGHHVIVPIGYTVPRKDDLVSLVRPTRHEFSSALEQAGYGEAEADALAVQTGCTLSAFRRYFGSYHPPKWATPEKLRSLVPAFLTGSWDATAKRGQESGDREFLQALAGKPYGQYEMDLAELATVADAPLMRVKGFWRVTAPIDAFYLVAPYITDTHLESLRQEAFKLFAQRDPALDLPPEERYMAAVKGKARNHSEALRDGVLGTLALLTHCGANDINLQTSVPASDVAYSLIRDLLKDADVDRWLSLNSNLDDLAEVSPRAFLEAIEASLAEEDPSIMALFQDGDSSFGNCMHASLLWGLEALAWEPRLLPRVCHVLAGLASLDPGGRWSNRPAASLSRILLPSLPATFASVEERLSVLDSIISDYPSVGWPLSLCIGSGSSWVVTGARHPYWIAVSGNDQSPKTQKELWDIQGRIAERIFSQLGTDADRWRAVIKNGLLTYSEVTSSWPNFLKTMAGKAQLEGDVAALRNEIRHRRYCMQLRDDVGKSDIAILEALEEVLAPADLIEKHKWLFENAWIRIPGSRGTDDKEASRLRQAAVDEIVESLGVEGIFGLIEASGDPLQIAFAVVDCAFTDAFHDALLTYATGQDPTEALRRFLRGYVSLRHGEAGWAWTDEFLGIARASKWPLESQLALLFGLPGGDETFNRIEGLGAPVIDEYWKRVNLWTVCREESAALENVFTRALDLGRSWDVVDRIEGVIDQVMLPTGLLVRALSDLASSCQGQGQVSTRHQYAIIKIFTELDRREDISDSEIAILEIPYIEIFYLSKREILAMHRIISINFNDFALLIQWLYKRQDDGEDEVSIPPERVKQHARIAWKVLHTWRNIPGISDGGVVDKDALFAWVNGARERCEALGRIECADSTIGEMLAHAPVDDDGIWPCIAVRDVVQAVKSNALERGVSNGLFNKRGVTTRGLCDGGIQERALASCYQGWANAQRAKWPRMAAVLDGMAKDYERYALIEDDEAQRTRLGRLS